MCVILIVDTARPSDEMIEKCFDQNSAGAGIAWREDGVVKWEKGLQLARITELCRRMPTPYVAHFRIPTEGGIRPGLCHPFPIDKNVPLDLNGQTKGFVLFHNGHWSDWRKSLLTMGIEHGVKLPMGKWSDTRGMACAAAHYGISILEMINEKSVAFGPKDIEITGAGWTIVDGVWCSNQHWKHRAAPYNGPAYNNQYVSTMCRERACTSKDLDDTMYCPKHTKKKPEVKDVAVVIGDDVNGESFEIGPNTPYSAKQAAVGGAVTESPFEKTFRLAFEGWKKGRLSNKKFKKARRVYDAYLKECKKNGTKLLSASPLERKYPTDLVKH